MNNFRFHIVLSAFLIIPAAVAAQAGQSRDSIAVSVRYLVEKGDSLHRVYRFEEASELFQKAEILISDSSYAHRDSSFIHELDEKILQAQNGKSMIDYAFNPTVVARQKFPLKDFFLFFPLKNNSWRTFPNVLDSRTDSVAQAVYVPESSREIYFSAHDEEGFMNIYRTEYQDSVWKIPELLNEHLTSSSDDILPMLSEDGKSLYFSSKGLYGMGGYDLYVSRWNPETKDWDVPENLGFPYSSPYDDFLFVNTPDGKYSMFASNRDCGRDSVNIYVLEYDSTPVRRSISDVSTIRKIASLSPVEDSFKMDNSSVTMTSVPADEDTRGYTEKMKEVRALRDSIFRVKSAVDEARLSLSSGKADGSLAETSTAEISKFIVSKEEQLRGLQGRLSASTAELQKIEMQFLKKGVVLDPGKLQKDADREVVGLGSNYIFSKNSIGEPLDLRIAKPKVVFDYSFKVLPEGQFALDNSLPSGLVYQIFLFASSAKADVGHLRGLSPVFETVGSNKRFSYNAGLFSTYADALANLNKVKRAGFRGAYIVAFNDGKAIAVKSAREMEKAVNHPYFLRIAAGGGAALSVEDLAVVRSLAEADIARISEDGGVSYLIGPYFDKSEIDVLADKLQAAGFSAVKIETADNEN